MFTTWRARYRGIPPLIWKLLFVQLIVSAGQFMAIPLLAIHLANHLNFGAGAIGTVLAVLLLSARLLPAVTGPIADWLGARGLIICGLLVRALGLAGVAFVTDVFLVTTMAFLIGAGTALYESAVYGIFGRQSKEIAPRIFILNNQALNAGVIFGPLLGTGVAVFGTSYAFVASAGVFLLLTFWGARFSPSSALRFESTNVWRSVANVLTDRRFLHFFVATLPWWFLFSQLYVAFPIYITRLGQSEAYVATMFVVNGAVGLSAMLISAVVFERFRASGVLCAAYIGLAILYPFVPVSPTVIWFLLFVGLYTVAETMILPAMETLTAEMAVRGSESTYFGAASLAWAIAGSVGNYTGGWLVLEASPETMWGTFAAVALIGACLALSFSRSAPVSMKAQGVLPNG